MRFFGLNPEVAGDLGDGTVMDYSSIPYRVVELDYCFEVWMGDDLLTSSPVVIVSERLKNALAASGLTGFRLASMQTTRSELFDDIKGKDFSLPVFWWLVLEGREGVDDFAESRNPAYSLVVSERALKLLRDFSLSQCKVEPL